MQTSPYPHATPRSNRAVAYLYVTRASREPSQRGAEDGREGLAALDTLKTNRDIYSPL